MCLAVVALCTILLFIFHLHFFFFLSNICSDSMIVMRRAGGTRQGFRQYFFAERVENAAGSLDRACWGGVALALYFHECDAMRCGILMGHGLFSRSSRVGERGSSAVLIEGFNVFGALARNHWASLMLEYGKLTYENSLSFFLSFTQLMRFFRGGWMGGCLMHVTHAVHPTPPRQDKTHTHILVLSVAERYSSMYVCTTNHNNQTHPHPRRLCISLPLLSPPTQKRKKDVLQGSMGHISHIGLRIYDLLFVSHFSQDPTTQKTQHSALASLLTPPARLLFFSFSPPSFAILRSYDLDRPGCSVIGWLGLVGIPGTWVWD